MTLKLPNRICIRYSQKEKQMLAELTGFRGLYELGSLFREGIRELHARMNTVFTQLPAAAPPRVPVIHAGPPPAAGGRGVEAPEEKPVVTNGFPADGPTLADDKERTEGQRLPKRVAKGPKSPDNQRPKKGTKDAARKGLHGVPRRSAKRAPTGGQEKAAPRPKRKPPV